MMQLSVQGTLTIRTRMYTVKRLYDFPVVGHQSLYGLTIMLLVANLVDTKGYKKTEKVTATLAYGYSSASIQQ